MSVEYYPVIIDEVIKLTNLAVLVDINGEEVWIPKSVIDGNVGVYSTEIYVAEWFLDRKGIDY